MNADSIRDWLKGEDALVVGAGPSAWKVAQHVYASHWTFGCNRAAAWCHPDFAVCFEPPGDSDCWDVVHASRPTFVLTHNGFKHPRAIELGSNDVCAWLFPGEKRDRLVLGMSPFYAAAAAMMMGCERIGLIGVDLTRDRFSNNNYVENAVRPAWRDLATLARERGQEIVNLNSTSRLEVIQHGDWKRIRGKR